MGRLYRVGELAALTGVSVRTLHHYDAEGLLRPAGHSEGGHRLYSEDDLLRLQQILTLRYLGFGLKEIGGLLDRADFDLIASLRIQRTALRERMAELERIEAALDAVLERRRTTGRWPWELVARAAATVQESLSERSEPMNRTRQLYTLEQMQQFEALGREVGPERIREIEEQWQALIAEVRAGRDLDPASAEARALADRWHALNAEIAQQYRAYPELWQAIGENYKNNAFAAEPRAPTPEDFAFIARVDAARTTGNE